jgi:hypothetical protein
MLVLLGLLAGSGALVLLDGSASDSGAPSVAMASDDQSRDSALRPPSDLKRPSKMILEIERRETSADPIDAFPVRDWNPPPPPPPKVEISPVPPLPFSFLGKKLEDGKWQVFLAYRDEIYIARENQYLDDHYLVAAIKPPTMTFTYLPLKQQQVLSIGESN